MEINSTSVNYTNVSVSEEMDIRIEAMSYTMYKIGEGINSIYFPIFVPIGVLGNIFSFLVMIQPHNRRMSISLYISVLAVSDTIVLCFAFLTYINMELETAWPSDRLLFCKVQMAILIGFMLSSNLIVISMTFDRFYSIIRPHKAASFNTVKRAKITCVFAIAFSLVYNSPHLYFTAIDGLVCVPYGLYVETLHNRIYFWGSAVVHFLLPFFLLLIMNGTIIFTLRNRLRPNITRSEGQGQGESQTSRSKSSERQIFMILLLVALAFFFLTTPVYAMIFYANSFDYTQSAKSFAEYFLFYNVGQKAVYTNYGINFFLYVMSGQKFRTDLIGLFRKKKKSTNERSTPSVQITTVSN